MTYAVTSHLLFLLHLKKNVSVRSSTYFINYPNSSHHIKNYGMKLRFLCHRYELVACTFFRELPMSFQSLLGWSVFGFVHNR